MAKSDILKNNSGGKSANNKGADATDASATKTENSGAFQPNAPKKPIKRNRLLFIGLLILLIAAVGFGYTFLKTEIQNSLTIENIKGDVKTLSEYSFTALDKIDGIKKGQLKRNDGGADYQKTYNLSGNLIEYLNLKNQTTIKSIYDDKQNIVEEISTDIDSVFLFTNKYKYDSDNNIIEKTQYDSVGTFNSKYTYRHDSNKNIIERNFYNSKKNLEGRLSYKYDTNNKLLENSKYDSAGNLKFKFTYIHDLNGNVIEKNVFDSSEKLKSKFTYEYKLDNNNNWVQCVEFENSLPTYILVRKIEYQLNNQKISNKEEFSLDYFYKGYHSKNSDTALFYFDKAILIDSSFASAYYEREKRWWNEGKGFTKAIEIDPNYIEAYRDRAKIGERGYGLGRKVAYKDYSKIIEINPRDVDAYLSRSELWYALFDFDRQRAEPYFLDDVNKALELDPNSARAHYLIGGYKWAKEDYLGAITSFNMALKIDPNFFEALNSRASCKKDFKDFEGAIGDYDKLIQSYSKSWWVPYWEFEIALIAALGIFDYESAMYFVNSAIETHKKNNSSGTADLERNFQRAYFLRAYLKQKSGNYKGACLDMRKAGNYTWSKIDWPSYISKFTPCQ